MTGFPAKPVLLLALVAGITGFVLGQRTGPSESDVIEHAADLFVAETGRSRSACLAVPGSDPVWVAVHCGSGPDARHYFFDRAGALLEAVGEPRT